MRTLAGIAQPSVQNGTDTRSIMMFNEGKKSFPLQFEGGHENHKETQEGI